MECNIYRITAIAEEYTKFLFLNRIGILCNILHKIGDCWVKLRRKGIPREEAKHESCSWETASSLMRLEQRGHEWMSG